MTNSNSGPGEGRGREDVAVSVITPSGIFPSDDTLQRVPSSSLVSDLLQLAATKLELTNTVDWLVKANGHELKPTQTFGHANLRCIVDLVWQPREGGGGA